MMGVLIVLAALIISLMRGTPNVTFILATPAKWNVFNVICVAGSPIDYDAIGPTEVPGGVTIYRNRSIQVLQNHCSYNDEIFSKFLTVPSSFKPYAILYLRIDSAFPAKKSTTRCFACI